MAISPRLSRYLAKQFFLSMGIVFLALVCVVILFDALEILRRAHNKDVPITAIVELVIMKQPFYIEQMISFVVLLGGILCFSRLTRTSELIVTRAAGVSAWQFLMPSFVVAFGIGLLVIIVFNPLSATMLSRFEKVEAQYLRGNSGGMLSVSSNGLWLRQKADADQDKMIIHAQRASYQDMELYEVSFYIFDANNRFLRRINAVSAALANDEWIMQEAVLEMPGYSETLGSYRLPTSLTIHQIQDSFAPPETVSFWELPKFIKTLKLAGFSATRHTLHFHSLLVLPFFLCAMVFFAATFSLRSPRQGKTGLLMSGGILAGLLIHFLSDLINAVGLSGSIPIFAAAWAPVMICILLGVVLMLHYEDG